MNAGHTFGKAGPSASESTSPVPSDEDRLRDAELLLCMVANQPLPPSVPPSPQSSPRGRRVKVLPRASDPLVVSNLISLPPEGALPESTNEEMVGSIPSSPIVSVSTSGSVVSLESATSNGMESGEPPEAAIGADLEIGSEVTESQNLNADKEVLDDLNGISSLPLSPLSPVESGLDSDQDGEFLPQAESEETSSSQDDVVEGQQAVPRRNPKKRKPHLTFNRRNYPVPRMRKLERSPERRSAVPNRETLIDIVQADDICCDLLLDNLHLGFHTERMGCEYYEGFGISKQMEHNKGMRAWADCLSAVIRNTMNGKSRPEDAAQYAARWFVGMLRGQRFDRCVPEV